MKYLLILICAIFYASKFYKVRFRGGKINDNTHCVSMSEIWNHHQLRLCHSTKKCEDVDYRGMTLHLCCHQISLQLHLRKERSAVEILNRPKSLPNAVSIHKNKNMDWNHISGDSQNGSLNYYGFNHNTHSDLKCDIVLSQITAIPLYIYTKGHGQLCLSW